MIMPQRSTSSGSYRYGFNGKENDNEVKGSGNQLNFGNRIYDSRLGRYLSIDPLYAKHADMAPYHHASNNPVNRIDPDGNDDIHFHYATRTIFMPDGRGGSKPHTQAYSWATVVKNNLPNTFAVHHHSININQNGDRGSTYTERVIPFHPEAKWPKPRSGVTASTFLGITVSDDDYTSLLKKLEDFPEIASKYPPEIRNPSAARSQSERNANFMWDAFRDSKARAAVMHEKEQVNNLMLGVISVAAGEFMVGRLLSSPMVRVGQWMPKANYETMLRTGRVAAEPGQGGMSFFTIDGPLGWGASAPKGYVYAEFEVARSSVLQAGKSTWLQAATEESNLLMRSRVLKQGGELSPRVQNLSPIKFSKPTNTTFKVQIP
jgi:RHS repeat-associated protein